jgi:two-component system cell cycle sensor histidine kinase/response regulator CckA
MHLLHDVRLVFEAISLSLHALQRRSAPDALAPEIDDAHHLLETGRALIDEALVCRTLRPTSPYIDLNSVLYDLSTILNTMTGPDIEIRVKMTSGDTRVFGQRGDLERIVLNLVQNAADAMRSGGVLMIGTEMVPGTPASNVDKVRLTIRDTGRGISEKTLRAALDPYARPRLDGTGYGLSSVSSIVRRLGARMTIEAPCGQGTIATIVFPLADPSF